MADNLSLERLGTPSKLKKKSVKLLIYANKNYYWIENTLKILKPLELCL